MTTPSSYLQDSDFATYGLAGSTDAQVAQASRLIDVYCRRARSGFVWVPDSTGQPAYMAAAQPEFTFTSLVAIAPGTGVNVRVQPNPVIPEMIGRPVIIDLGNAETAEMCIITAVNTPSNGYITLGVVQNEHSTLPVLMQGGLQIFEERYLPSDRSIARCAQWPVVSVPSAQGRYSYGRRSQQVAGNFSEFNLLSILQNFGGPSPWVPIDVTQLGINPTTGEMWIPAGILLAYYSDLRVWYLAGWQQQYLPLALKQACANVVSNMIQVAGTPMQSSLFKKIQTGDTSIERFADAAIDDQTKLMLEPFRASLYV